MVATGRADDDESKEGIASLYTNAAYTFTKPLGSFNLIVYDMMNPMGHQNTLYVRDNYAVKNLALLSHYMRLPYKALLLVVEPKSRFGRQLTDSTPPPYSSKLNSVHSAYMKNACKTEGRGRGSLSDQQSLELTTSRKILLKRDLLASKRSRLEEEQARASELEEAQAQAQARAQARERERASVVRERYSPSSSFTHEYIEWEVQEHDALLALQLQRRQMKLDPTKVQISCSLRYNS